MEIEIRGLRDEIDEMIERHLVKRSAEAETSLRDEVKKDCDPFASRRGNAWSTTEDENFKMDWIELIGIMAKRHKRSFSGIVCRYKHLRGKGWSPYHS